MRSLTRAEVAATRAERSTRWMRDHNLTTQAEAEQWLLDRDARRATQKEARIARMHANQAARRLTSQLTRAIAKAERAERKAESAYAGWRFIASQRRQHMLDCSNCYAAVAASIARRDGELSAITYGERTHEVNRHGYTTVDSGDGIENFPNPAYRSIDVQALGLPMRRAVRWIGVELDPTPIIEKRRHKLTTLPCERLGIGTKGLTHGRPSLRRAGRASGSAGRNWQGVVESAGYGVQEAQDIAGSLYLADPDATGWYAPTRETVNDTRVLAAYGIV